MKLFHLDNVNFDPDYCFVDAPLPVGAEVQLAEAATPKMERLGIDILDLFMDEDRGGLKLPDYVSNTDEILPLSERCLEAFNEGFDIGDHEILACQLINGKKRVHSDKYAIVNFLSVTDCLDQDRSDIDNTTDFLLVEFMGKWCLDSKRVPPGRDLFRVDGVIGFIFTERLVDFIKSSGFTNFQFEPVTLG